MTGMSSCDAHNLDSSASAETVESNTLCYYNECFAVATEVVDLDVNSDSFVVLKLCRSHALIMKAATGEAIAQT